MNAAGTAADHSLTHSSMKGVVAAPFGNPFHEQGLHSETPLGPIFGDRCGSVTAMVDRSMEQIG